ncbi:hypothetical protein Nmel_002069 [Mimus melanotis]
MGKLYLGLGLAAAQARAGEASGCIPVSGWNGSCTGAGAGARTGHILRTGLRKSAVSLQSEVSPGDRRQTRSSVGQALL